MRCREIITFRVNTRTLLRVEWKGANWSNTLLATHLRILISVFLPYIDKVLYAVKTGKLHAAIEVSFFHFSNIMYA